MAWSAQLSAYVTKSAVVRSVKTKIGPGTEKELLVWLKKKNKKIISF